MRDYDLVPGYPAEPTRVYPATERIFPKPVRESRRLKCKMYDMKYRDRVGWPVRKK